MELHLGVRARAFSDDVPVRPQPALITTGPVVCSPVHDCAHSSRRKRQPRMWQRARGGCPHICRSLTPAQPPPPGGQRKHSVQGSREAAAAQSCRPSACAGQVLPPRRSKVCSCLSWPGGGGPTAGLPKYAPLPAQRHWWRTAWPARRCSAAWRSRYGCARSASQQLRAPRTCSVRLVWSGEVRTGRDLLRAKCEQRAQGA